MNEIEVLADLLPAALPGLGLSLDPPLSPGNSEEDKREGLAAASPSVKAKDARVFQSTPARVGHRGPTLTWLTFTLRL